MSRKAFAGATPQVLVLLFAAMFGLFVFAGILTASFRAEKRERAERHAAIALTLSQYGDYEHAIEHYRDALIYSRDNIEYRLGLAMALYYLERYNEAELQLVELRAADPTRGAGSRRHPPTTRSHPRGQEAGHPTPRTPLWRAQVPIRTRGDRAGRASPASGSLGRSRGANRRGSRPATLDHDFNGRHGWMPRP
jgi:tetratricopeptide (TPR) repeat protein